MDLLKQFSFEVLEMIFSHLSEREILESTLISPTVNKIISNSLRLMRNIRFKVEGRRSKLGTRKYKKIDLLEIKSFSILKILPEYLTEITVESCKVKVSVFHTMLSIVSNSIEIIIISDCNLDLEGRYSDYDKVDKKSYLPFFEFPKLKTLLMVDITGESRYFLLSVIKATNLTDLGLIDARYQKRYPKFCIVDMMLELIKRNSNLKRLHIPLEVSEAFLAYALSQLEVEYKFEELGLLFAHPICPVTGVDFCDEALEFFKTQRDTLKSVKLDGCVISELQATHLLSLNLARLELYSCNMVLQPHGGCDNFSIESLTFIMCGGTAAPESVCNFVQHCKNLCAIDVFFAGYYPVLPEAMSSWTLIDTLVMRAKRIAWSDLRSLRYAGVAIGIETVRNYSEHLFYQFRSKRFLVETHPFSTVQWKVANFTRRVLLKPFINETSLKIKYSES